MIWKDIDAVNQKLRPDRADQALRDPPARPLPGGGRADADAEGQALGRLQEVRARRRRALRGVRRVARARPRAIAASVRVRQDSLSRMLRTCMSTVRGLRNSSWAISRFVRPTETSRITSSSRRERPAVSCSAAARRPRCGSSGSPRRANSAAAAAARGLRPELARAAVGLLEPLERRLALARGGQRDAGPQRDLRALERDLQARPAVRARAPIWCAAAVGVTLGQRGLAERVGERRQRVRMAGRRGDRRQRLRCTRAPAARSPLGGEDLRGGAQAPDRVVVVLAALPALQHGAEVLLRGRRVAGVGGDPAERGRAVDAHRDDVEPRGGRGAAVEQRAAGAGVAAEAEDRAEHAVGHERVVGAGVAGAELAAELARTAPSRRARAGRRPCSSGRPAPARRRRSPRTGSRRCRARRAPRRSRRRSRARSRAAGRARRRWSSARARARATARRGSSRRRARTRRAWPARRPRGRTPAPAGRCARRTSPRPPRSPRARRRRRGGRRSGR